MTTEKKIDAAARRPALGAKDRTEGHLWLQRMVGEWTVETEFTMSDGATARASGHESVRPLGEYWVVIESACPMPDDGSEGHMIISLGYDHRKARFVGSVVGSMMTGLWVYEGDLDADGTLVLDADGEDMADDTKTATYRDTTRWEGDDVRVSTSHAQDESGAWQPFMAVRSTRVR